MANVRISNFPVPFALPVAAVINGTETLPFDQTVAGVVTTRSGLFSRLLGPIAVNYSTGVATVSGSSAPLVVTGRLIATSTVVTASLGESATFIGFAARPGYIGIQDGQAGSSKWWLQSGFDGAGGFSIGPSTGSLPFTISTAGNVVVNAPTSGLALTVVGTGTGDTMVLDCPAATRFTDILFNNNGTLKAQVIWDNTNVALELFTPSRGISIAGSTGAVTVTTPSSGVALTVNGLNGSAAANFTNSTNPFIQVTDGTVTAYMQGVTGVPSARFGSLTNHTTEIVTNATVRLSITNAGVATFNAPSAGTTLTVRAVAAGTNAFAVSDGTNSLNFTPNTTCLLNVNNALALQIAGTAALSIASTRDITCSTRLGMSGTAPAAQVTGFGTPTGGTVVANFPGAGPATLAQCSNTIAEILLILKGLGIIGA